MLFGAKSDIGKVREHNEDSFGCKDNLFVVADGMGGHRAGEVASSIAVETILAGDISRIDEAGLERLILDANHAILAEAEQNPDLNGMGTTVAVLVLFPEKAIVAHVGDSRIYRYTVEGELIRLTDDHSLVAELVKRGELTETEAKDHPQRNMLTRALGTKGTIEVETMTLPVRPGDKFLLCSDGLTGMVDEDTIRQVLAGNDAPTVLAEQLVTLAVERGGIDNVTVVIVEH